MNTFWRVVSQVNWYQSDNGKIIKIWIDFDNLEEFIRLLGIDSEHYLECTLLENGIYLELNDMSVYRYFDFENVNDFILQTGIKEY